MKKIILGTAAFLLLLFLIFLGWLYHRKYQSFQTSIPKNINSIVRINVDGICKTIAYDFLTSPGSYTPSNKKKEEEYKQELSIGLEVPANIFLYTLKDQPWSTVIGSLRIENEELFKTFLKEQTGSDTFEVIRTGIAAASIKKLKLHLLFTGKKVVFAFSQTELSSEVKATMLDILDHRNIISAGDDFLKRLRTMDNHVSFINRSSEGTIDFKDGLIDIRSTFLIGSRTIPERSYHVAFNKESVIKGWSDGDIHSIVPLMDFKIKDKLNFLNPDSLLRYSDQHLEFEMVGTIGQTDTVISYSYDDNFEKVEEKTIEEKVVPEIYVTFNNNDGELLSYLQRNKVLDKSLKVAKDIFPLFNLYASTKGDYLQLSSSEKSQSVIRTNSSDNFLYLLIDFGKMRNQQLFPELNQYLNSLDSLQITGRKLDKKTSEIKGSIYFTDKNSNSLYSIISNHRLQ